MMTVALWATAAALVAVSLQGQVTAQVVDAAATTWWRPRLGYKFQYQLKMAFDVKRDFIPGVQVYLIDGFEATNADVAVILSKGFFPICYFSAGSYEDWRPDKGLFQASDYGSKLSGWAGEFWLDVRSANVKVIMTARMKMCKAKGFVGIDPDNVDAFANPSGFPLTAADQLAYNKWLAATAHGLGLAVGLKNDVGQIQDLVGDFDYFVNEQCQEYGECGVYAPVKAVQKPVWAVEYVKSKFTDACLKQLDYGIRTLYKADPQLSSDWVECAGVAYPDPDPSQNPNPSTSPSLGPSPSPPPSTFNKSWWAPTMAAGLQFNILTMAAAFNPSVDLLPGVQVFILDWHAATANAGASITGASSVPVCWLSVGTALKPSKTSTTLGLALGDYGKRFKGKDYYIDIKSAAVRAAMIQIMTGCKSNGFVAIVLGLADTYAKRNGLDFSEADQIVYNRWLADAAHNLGLGVGLQNDVDHISQLVDAVDFFVNEDCGRKKECDAYQAARSANKPVFNVEYSGSGFKAACRCTAELGLATISKRTSLKSLPRATCTPQTKPCTLV